MHTIQISVSVNKVVLEHRRAHLCMYHFMAAFTPRLQSCNTSYGPQTWEYLPAGPIRKNSCAGKYAGPCYLQYPWCWCVGRSARTKNNRWCPWVNGRGEVLSVSFAWLSVSGQWALIEHLLCPRHWDTRWVGCCPCLGMTGQPVGRWAWRGGRPCGSRALGGGQRGHLGF